MTVGQLKTLLEDHADEQEVRLMHQSNYPLESEFAGIWEWTQIFDDEDPDGEGFEPGAQEDDAPILYLVEGTQIGYGTSRAWKDIEVP